jgi:hypothetical protein
MGFLKRCQMFVPEKELSRLIWVIRYGQEPSVRFADVEWDFRYSGAIDLERCSN